MKHLRLSLAVGMAVLLPIALIAGRAEAQATFTLINQDPAGSGLNDAAAKAPEGGNPGRTLGEQRLIAYQYAMDLWGALLSSNVDIRVRASFAPLECNLTTDRIILGSANAVYRKRDFPNAPKAGLEYPAAMANSIAGSDLEPTRDDITTNFQADLATPRCGNREEWYYGLQGNAGNTRGGPNFLNVIMHEIGHGLGVSGGITIFGEPGAKNIYSELAFSKRANGNINSLSTENFQAAIGAPWDIVWTGARANASARLIAENRPLLVQTTDASPVQHLAREADFGNQALEAFPAGKLVLVQDVAAAGTTASARACEGIDGQPAIANGDALRGNIALIDRGSCEFGRKALNAQRYGAIAAIIVDNAASAKPPSLGPGADGGNVTIPVIGVTQSVGQLLRAGTAPVQLTGLVRSPTLYSGMDSDNRTYLYSSATWQNELGSVLSHIDTDMAPNALMEPSETRSVEAHAFVDLALDMYEDMGWRVNRQGTAHLGSCDTGVPVVRDVGYIPGANLIAQQRLCRAEADGSRAKYQQCMNNHALWLRDQGLLSNGEVASVRKCVAQQPLAQN